jgi:nickel/cobalt transporter (NicO) family protein
MRFRLKKRVRQSNDVAKKIFCRASIRSCRFLIAGVGSIRHNESMNSTAILRFAVTCGAHCLLASTVFAHPLSKDDAHDRTIIVRLQKGDAPNRIRVRVEYRLEAAEDTILRRDMLPYRDEIDFLDYFPQRPLEYYGLFAKKYEGILADRLIASVDKKPLPGFRCVQRKPRLVDEDGMALGHLRCDFVFESTFDIDPGRTTQFDFEDKTYYLEEGRIWLSLVDDSGQVIESIRAPTEAMREQAAKMSALDDDRLRQIQVVFAPSAAPPAKSVEPPPAPTPQPRESHGDRFALLPLILHNDYGLALTLLLAFAFGAAHALTPGHGKTLVAAYLVGERGTVWHALYLGVITTLTHTGVVMIFAVIVALLPADQQQAIVDWLVNGLGLVMGLMVVGIGFWLLLQRLAGRADHVHLGNGHHHHHGQSETAPSARSLSWWGLTLLGITGGMVPCVDAIILFVWTVGSSRFWLVLPAVFAFSAGLAAVLVVIGILVVQVPRFAESRFGGGRLLRALPVASALVVTLMGLWLCFDAVRGH